jgi:hypothetical protein
LVGLALLPAHVLLPPLGGLALSLLRSTSLR